MATCLITQNKLIWLTLSKFFPLVYKVRGVKPCAVIISRQLHQNIRQSLNQILHFLMHISEERWMMLLWIICAINMARKVEFICEEPGGRYLILFIERRFGSSMLNNNGFLNHHSCFQHEEFYWTMVAFLQPSPWTSLKAFSATALNRTVDGDGLGPRWPGKEP